MLAAVIASITLIAIVAVFIVAHLVDRNDARSLYRAHRKQQRVRTVLTEPKHDSRIVGEWIKP